ncbi:MAG: sigma-54-dependent Fis family transcriptional regulator [Candidatus Marinimicrobia bacterium]|nr:sigma-54-dependent Fis family transcriptional regulator [Candidatus Neomarinimicrobiota bacterium]|tara:strand:- start:5000 stop:6217 length:1218 start_codon:yes stop_codon:yes gene_type:complete
MVDFDKIKKSVGMIGESEPMQDMLNLIGQVSNTEISVLINGESGSGKEMVAKAVHKNSRRKFENLITVNCGAIPEGIIESELFGHKKGSFTGAGADRKGYFEAAHKGTIFLDEIGETPLETQAKLLRVIEEGEFIKVGDTKTQKVDARIIAATNKDLADEVVKNNFRKDLYFRLKTITINVPNLRDRLTDIHLFVERFGLQFCAKNDIAFKGFSSDAINALKSYAWPGNVRELKNIVESLIVQHKGQRIGNEMVLKVLGKDTWQSNPNLPTIVDKDKDEIERELILRQLLYIRQDINELKQLFYGNKYPLDQVQPSNKALYLPPVNSEKDKEEIDIDSIKDLDDGRYYSIRDESIGELGMNDIEHEMIERTLQKFNHNRRKTAKSLNISERTLYRKIQEYGIIKK